MFIKIWIWNHECTLVVMQTAEISSCCRKSCPTKNYVRRKLCPPKFCLIRYCFISYNSKYFKVFYLLTLNYKLSFYNYKNIDTGNTWNIKNKLRTIPEPQNLFIFLIEAPIWVCVISWLAIFAWMRENEKNLRECMKWLPCVQCENTIFLPEFVKIRFFLRDFVKRPI